MIYQTREKMRDAWGTMAIGKLQADHIDANNVQAARNALVPCAGGIRLFEFWLEYTIIQAIGTDAGLVDFLTSVEYGGYDTVIEMAAAFGA